MVPELTHYPFARHAWFVPKRTIAVIPRLVGKIMECRTGGYDLFQIQLDIVLVQLS